MNCKKHCPCYTAMVEKRRESGRKGAMITNAKYTTEKRKKAWEKRRKNLKKK